MRREMAGDGRRETEGEGAGGKGMGESLKPGGTLSEDVPGCARVSIRSVG